MTDTDKQITAKDDLSGGGNSIEDYIVGKDGNTIGCDGPLAKAYSEALSSLYKKEIDPITGLALETQAQDVQYAEKELLAGEEAKVDIDENDENMSLLYGVQKGFTTPKEVMAVTDHFSRMNDEAKSRSVVIIDTTAQSGTGNPEVSTKGVKVCEAALEALCAAHKVPLMKSLSQYIKLTS